MEYILLVATICGTMFVFSKCLFIYVDQFYELDFDIFALGDE